MLKRVRMRIANTSQIVKNAHLIVEVGSRAVLRVTYMDIAIELLNPVILVDFS